MNKEVALGEIIVTSDPDNLTTTGVGSCAVVALYDPRHKIGALAHPILPGKNPLSVDDTRYIDMAIGQMLKTMQKLGARKEDIEAKLIGGANMFTTSDPSEYNSVGNQNIASAKETLKKQGIPIVGECVGGSQGRSVEFSITTGIVTVKTKF